MPTYHSKFSFVSDKNGSTLKSCLQTAINATSGLSVSSSSALTSEDDGGVSGDFTLSNGTCRYQSYPERMQVSIVLDTTNASVDHQVFLNNCCSNLETTYIAELCLREVR